MANHSGSTRRQAIGAGLATSVVPAIAATAPVQAAVTPATEAPKPRSAPTRNPADRAAYEASYRQSFLALRRAETQMHQLFEDILDRAGRRDLAAGDVVILFDATEGGQSDLLNNGIWRDERAQRRKRAMVKAGLIVGARKAGRYRYGLTSDGRAVLALVNTAVTAQAGAADPIGGLTIDALEQASRTIARTERWWVDIVRYKL